MIIDKHGHIINTTLWDEIKTFFNNNFNEVVTRKQLSNYLKEIGYNGSYFTMDTYRNYLKKAKYLQTIKRGRYKCIKKIPIDLSTNDVKSEAYGKITENVFYNNNTTTTSTDDIIWSTKEKNEFLSEDEMEI